MNRTLRSPVLLLGIAALSLVTACGAAMRPATSTSKGTTEPTSSATVPFATPFATPAQVTPSPTPTVPFATPLATPAQATLSPTPTDPPTSSPTPSPSPAPQAAVTLYSIATYSSVAHLHLGPDGALWFTTEGMGSNEFGKITTAGVVTTWPLPWASGGGDMSDFTFGGGFLWSTDVHGLNDSYIGQWTITGKLVHEFPVPWTAYAITWGPGGTLWFSGALVSGMELDLSYVGSMTVDGVVTTYYLPDTSDLAGGLTAGPDGDIWFSEDPGSHVGRVTTSGAITETRCRTPRTLGARSETTRRSPSALTERSGRSSTTLW